MDRRGRYEIGRAFASGATSTVHLARIEGTASLVAIKKLHPHLATGELERVLADEAKLASAIAHPNVVQVHEVFEDDGELLLVMEYVEGETLARLLAEGERVAPATAVAMACDVLRGLHAAHHARDADGAPLALVHRDIGPRNIVVTPHGCAKVLDFGIARARGRARTTRAGHVRGTLVYMAPEQLEGDAVTFAVDLYGVAAVLWECLTGTIPFDAESEGATTKRILDHDIRPPSSLVDDLPRALDAAIMRGLARDPDARFGTALEMAMALEDALAPAAAAEVGEWVMRRAGAAIAERRAAFERDDGVADTPRKTEAPRRARLVAPLVLMLVVAGGGTLAFWPAPTRPVPIEPIASASPAPSSSPTPADVGEAPSSNTVASPASTAPSVPPPRAVVGARPTASATPSASASTSASGEAAARCSPFWVDSAGVRRFNRECLR
jgi:tRNA A-37 threonylcarbamoyl transferase component Bud32